MVKKELTISVAQPKLWSLENPYLYTIKTTLSKGGKVIDRTETQAGIRELQDVVYKKWQKEGSWVRLLYFTPADNCAKINPQPVCSCREHTAVQHDKKQTRKKGENYAQNSP